MRSGQKAILSTNLRPLKAFEYGYAIDEHVEPWHDEPVHEGETVYLRGHADLSAGERLVSLRVMYLVELAQVSHAGKSWGDSPKWRKHGRLDWWSDAAGADD